MGDFSDLEGKSIEEILTRIPSNAKRRELTSKLGKVTGGFEYRWIDNGKKYRVRIHGADASAPAGSDAANGWVVRIIKGRRYYDYSTNSFREAKYTNSSGDFF